MIKVGPEVWIATALLHKENPSQTDFAVGDIVSRVRREKLTPNVRSGVLQHVTTHAVAQKPPNPGRLRFLTETVRGRRRLFRPQDSYHTEREGSPTVPTADELPEKYRMLLDWYRDWFLRNAGGSQPAPSSAIESTKAVLRRFAGCLTKEEGEEMMRAIADEFERMDENEDEAISA